VGGLSVWREIVAELPQLDTVYVADQAHIPYGARPPAQILEYARGICRFLVDEGCTAIVMACNAASAAALLPLRHELPGLDLVGMEPAIKPAAHLSARRVVGVLATPPTLAGELFRATLARHAADVHVVEQPCPGLVELVEAGVVDGPRVESVLRRFLAPSITASADVLVLACTHYPFLRNVIARVAGPDVRILDPAPAVAQQVKRIVVQQQSARANAAALPAVVGEPRRRFYTTGDRSQFENVSSLLLGKTLTAAAARWDSGALHPCNEPG
jgi:glutamate racemase